MSSYILLITCRAGRNVSRMGICLDRFLHNYNVCVPLQVVLHIMSRTDA